MKVLILSTMYPNSKLYVSGIFVHEQVKELKKSGCEVVVVSPIPYVPRLFTFFSAMWKKYKEIPEVETIDGVLIYHSRYIAIPKGVLKHYWSYSYVLALRNLFKQRRIEFDFDIIHAHGALPNDHAAFLLSKKYNIPYIVTIHGDTVYSFVNKKRKLKTVIKSLKFASAIISVSSQVTNRIIALLNSEDNIYTILNGFQPQLIEDKSKRANLTDSINILFVATLVERKGCEFLLRAFKELYKNYSNTKLIIVGGGELFYKLQHLSQKLKIDGRTTFTGALEHSDVLEYMKDCDIFVLPSWDEAFGVVYLEAMSFKKPVIGTEGEGICDVVKDGVNGLLVKPRSSESIIKKMKLLIQSKQMRNELGVRGYESIKDLTWERNANETLEIYKMVVEKESLHTIN